MHASLATTAACADQEAGEAVGKSARICVSSKKLDISLKRAILSETHMVSAERKAERLMELEQLLLAHRSGLRRSEIAECLMKLEPLLLAHPGGLGHAEGGRDLTQQAKSR